MERRKRAAYRPGTLKNHLVQIRSFLSFCVFYSMDYIRPGVNTLCLYIEFLAQSLKSPATVINYVSGIRLLHNLLDIKCTSIDNFQVQLMLRAVKITRTYTPIKRLPVSITLLTDLCKCCDSLGLLGRTVKCALLFGFYGFLRRSNLVPSTSAFDISRHTCRGDVLEDKNGLVIILKWTKTLQDKSKVFLIPLPRIRGSKLCPVTAYRQMCLDYPTTDANQPLFIIPSDSRRRRWQLLTAPYLARVFKTLVSAAGYNPSHYSLHSLRSGGASASYKAGTDATLIKRHGSWTSDVFWKYVITDSVNDSDLPRRLARYTRRAERCRLPDRHLHLAN